MCGCIIKIIACRNIATRSGSGEGKAGKGETLQG